jgi:hypothetical protein
MATTSLDKLTLGFSHHAHTPALPCSHMFSSVTYFLTQSVLLTRAGATVSLHGPEYTVVTYLRRSNAILKL